jgi:hypothetical protein
MSFMHLIICTKRGAMLHLEKGDDHVAEHEGSHPASVSLIQLPLSLATSQRNIRSQNSNCSSHHVVK